MKKIVITGAAGYIGSSLCEWLLDNLDCEIYAFDNMYYKQGTLVSKILSRDRITFHKEDVLNWSDNLLNSIAKSDFIIPLAALVGAPLCEKYPSETVKINQAWYRDLLKIATNQVIIYPNTNSGYGTTGDVICDERTPTNPLSLYAQTKDNSEKMILRGHSRSIVFRLATVFGCSFRTRTDLLINNLVKNAIENGSLTVFDGHFRRNYIHVKDICRAFLFAINNHDKMVGEVYNLGNDKINTTKMQLVEKVCEITGASMVEDKSRTDPDKRDYVVSSEKINKLGYEAIYSLDYGIKEMIKFYSIWNSEDALKCRNY